MRPVNRQGERTDGRRGWTIAALLAAASLPAAEAPPAWNLADTRSRAVVVESLRTEAETAKTAAWRQAAVEGWSPRVEFPGGVYELQAIRNGVPRVYITQNANAAISTAAHRVRNTAPYSVNGSGWTIGEWDGGAARSTHRELTGRVTVKDGGSTLSHSTHVAGTLGAVGVTTSALGMAPGVAIDSYEWNNDLSEMTDRAMATAGQSGKIQLSNHSYGDISGWYQSSLGSNYWYGVWGNRESDLFGRYDSDARSWDSICYNAPYFLPFKSAGNDRNDTPPGEGTKFYYYSSGWKSKTFAAATDPYSDGFDSGYDTIPTVGVAKNALTVGAVDQAVSNGVRFVSAAGMTAFSGWGPADDGRIKPDIVADGGLLYSCYGSSDSAYANSSGTSMAAPNACGSAVLLLDCYADLFPGQTLRASTLKGLIVHTADDLGRAGPDYCFGWGLMNTEAAANLLRLAKDHPQMAVVTESSLASAANCSTNLFGWDGSSAIRVTLCWTDPPGTAQTGLDNPTKALVNDLDLRVYGPSGQTHAPYVLDPAQPASVAATGDNNRDNIEQVLVASPGASGVYRAVVSVHGALTGGAQHYSLLFSGTAAATSSLTVAGSPAQYGMAAPSYGTHDYSSGSALSATAQSPHSEADARGIRIYACTGWVGTGSVPVSGTTTNTGSFTLLADSTVTWRWALTDAVVSNQTVNAATNLTARDTIRAGDGYRIVQPGSATFRAGRHVRLTPGFQVSTGAQFRATAGRE